MELIDREIRDVLVWVLRDPEPPPEPGTPNRAIQSLDQEGVPFAAEEVIIGPQVECRSKSGYRIAECRVESALGLLQEIEPIIPGDAQVRFESCRSIDSCARVESLALTDEGDDL